MRRRSRLVLVSTLLVLVGGLIAGGCSVFGTRAGTEEAVHSVLVDDGDVEIRDYAPALVARTVATGTYDEASRSGFRRLAGFIFGKNVSSESVAMTAPVLQQPESESVAMTAPVLQQRDGERWTMEFVMPAEYTRDTLPVPTDPDVEIVEVPGRTVAAIRYSGFISDAAIDEHAAELLAWLAANGWEAVSEPVSAGYDPPWTIPFLRRNEVLVEVRRSKDV